MEVIHIVCEKCGKEYKWRHRCEYVCECGRKFENSQAYVGHCGHCKIHLGEDPPDRFGSSRAWAKGKNKYTDERILAMSKRLKENPPNSFSGHRHTEETKRVMSEKARINAKNHKNGWKSGDNRVPNKYELFTEQFLDAEGIPYKREFVVPRSVSGSKAPYYQLDFLIDDKIDLEIDGSSHKAENDERRDLYIGKLYQVYRIKHNDSIDQLRSELSQFVSTYDISPGAN